MKVSTFLTVGGGAYAYAYLLVVWNDYRDPVREELQRQADAFGRDLGARGVFVEPYPSHQNDITYEVLAKPWPDDIRREMDASQDPFILVVRDSFAAFDPREHPYAIIWLSRFQQQPEDLLPMLKTLAQKTRNGDDVIAYLLEVARRHQAEAALDAAGAAAGLGARLAS